MKQQKLALVTGGNRGIGLELVNRLSSRGDVLTLSRQPVKASVAQQSGAGVVYSLKVDLSQPAHTCQMLDDWLTAHPQYQISQIFFNAASLSLGKLIDAGLEDVEVTLRTNVISSHMILSHLIRSQRFDKNGGQITFVSSSLARPDPQLTFCGIGLYSMSKAAAGRLAMSWARECALYHPTLQIARVHPGIVDTGMQQELRNRNDIDPHFAVKTEGLPAYSPGDWNKQVPAQAMRTIPAEMAADFVLWAGERADHQASEFDYYHCDAYHTQRESRLAELKMVSDGKDPYKPVSTEQAFDELETTR